MSTILTIMSEVDIVQACATALFTKMGVVISSMQAGFDALEEKIQAGASVLVVKMDNMDTMTQAGFDALENKMYASAYVLCTKLGDDIDTVERRLTQVEVKLDTLTDELHKSKKAVMVMGCMLWFNVAAMVVAMFLNLLCTLWMVGCMSGHGPAAQPEQTDWIRGRSDMKIMFDGIVSLVDFFVHNPWNE